MCGITGLLYLDKERRVNENLLNIMTDSLSHRGPDSRGIYLDKNLGFGFRRLSIIDLTAAGDQPMCNEDETRWIVFNGEIYNYFELRKDLLKRGHYFKTHTDTEVILHAYEEWNENCLTRLDGMFAFAIWDSKTKEMFLARDRFGIKPLYYYDDNNIFIFASEIKSILAVTEINKDINYSALSNYFSFMSIPAPQTIYKNIHKFMPAYFMKVNSSGISKYRRYWELDIKEDIIRSEDDWIDEIKTTFENTVKKHLVSDVPVAIMLSGGIDSSSVVAYASKIMNEPVRTFSVSFRGEDMYDESSYQRIISKTFNTNHTEFVATLDILDTAEKIIKESDEPFAVYSALPLYHINKEVSGFSKVVLTGDGGDEVFAGYDIRYKVLGLLKYFKYCPNYLSQIAYSTLNGLYNNNYSYGISRLRRFALYCLQNLDGRYLTFSSVIDDNQKDNIFHQEVLNTEENKSYEFYQKYFSNCPPEGLNRYIYFDLITSLTNEMLTKLDRTTSMVGIEGRVPFLDKDLVELAFRIPTSMKVSQPSSFFKLIKSLDNKGGKMILKKAFRDILPAEVINRPKAGFSVPLERWLESYDLESIAIEEDKIVKYEHFIRLVKAFREGQNHLANQIWVFINYYLWRHQI